MQCNGMDYMALRNGLHIKCSVTEWIMPGLTRGNRIDYAWAYEDAAPITEPQSKEG